MKKTWIMLALSGTMLASIVGGVTLALFSASSAPSNTELVAGRLEITGNRDNGDTVPGPMFYIGPGGGLYETGLWAPGDEFHRVFEIENTGSLDAWLKEVRTTYESGSLPLADELQVRVTTDPDGADLVATGTLGQFITAPRSFTAPISLPVGEIQFLHFWVELPRETGNSLQGQSLQVSFSVYGEQQAHNP